MFVLSLLRFAAIHFLAEISSFHSYFSSNSLKLSLSPFFLPFFLFSLSFLSPLSLLFYLSSSLWSLSFPSLSLCYRNMQQTTHALQKPWMK